MALRSLEIKAPEPEPPIEGLVYLETIAPL